MSGAQFQVRVVGLPKLLLPLAEGHPGPTLKVVHDATFADLPGALDHAKPLAQTGYALEISGPGGLLWDHRRVIHELNAPQH